MPEMGRDEARRRFGAARVARLATIGPAGRPHLVPVVFARRGDDVVTAVDDKPKRSRRLARLRHISVQPAVSLLVDAYDEDWDRLWWVRADGEARTLPPGAPDARTRQEYAGAVELLRCKYPQYRQRPPEGPVIAVGVLRWTGWRAVQEDDGAW
ncbi:PPOX class F420-dependent oxidoreductase [Streptomyces viridiviolaceus]|uniref:TIGR03668 family PPOX class F420-dependent oxidoreductase n=1 Tax=Streptomyces viridiviolaceus TaxID=68282 RepID=A0ABW2E514_9ACTN|nr:TIGR03668 family PPOX class F420-dependent oxidoreductase [Streptomyces viridiviolaceus]GHB42301.1 PPOX class F420-dependent oxidoreductase [Streptomyces viridiviolaceus]